MTRQIFCNISKLMDTLIFPNVLVASDSFQIMLIQYIDEKVTYDQICRKLTSLYTSLDHVK